MIFMSKNWWGNWGNSVLAQNTSNCDFSPIYLRSAEHAEGCSCRCELFTQGCARLCFCRASPFNSNKQMAGCWDASKIGVHTEGCSSKCVWFTQGCARLCFCRASPLNSHKQMADCLSKASACKGSSSKS